MIEEKEYDFAKALKTIRESRGMMQKDLGAAMGIDPNRISNWELGYSSPTLKVFRLMCVALNCPPGDLLGLSPNALSADEYNLLKRYRQLDDAGKHTVEAVLDSQMLRLGAD